MSEFDEGMAAGAPEDRERELDRQADEIMARLTGEGDAAAKEGQGEGDEVAVLYLLPRTSRRDRNSQIAPSR